MSEISEARLGERLEVDMLNPYRITSVPAKVWRDVAAEALEEIAGRKSESYEGYSDRLESYFRSPAAIDAARSHPPTATYKRGQETP